MSSRKLIFSKGESHWQCQCRQWHEDLARDVEIENFSNTRPQLLVVAGFPSLTVLAGLLSAYNNRSLTYDDDVLLAIAGLLSILSRTFTGGFLSGLPEMTFDTALGWKPDDSGGLRKRVPSQRRRQDQHLPTWSWLSWQGSIMWGDHGEANVRDVLTKYQGGGHRIQETSPMTQWYISDAPDGKPRRKIVPTWYEERERAKDPSQPLADGWTRREATAGLVKGKTRLFPDGCGAYVY